MRLQVLPFVFIILVGSACARSAVVEPTPTLEPTPATTGERPSTEPSTAAAETPDSSRAATLSPTSTAGSASADAENGGDGTTESYQLPGDYLDSLVVDGLERWFVVHLPPTYKPGDPSPMVLNLHGRTSNAVEQEAVSQMNKKADEEGFVAVYPQALGQPTTWFGVFHDELGQPDMDFFRELLTHLNAQISVDPARIYATGLSNGATMVNRLGCDMGDVFAAIAPVAGGHSAIHLCEIDQPISVLVIHGTDDPIIPYEGNNNDIPPVRFWVQAWAERNKCVAEPETRRLYDDVIFESWDQCDDEVAVAFYTVEGGGHSWLNLETRVGDGGFEPAVGATDVIWEFFNSHPKAKAP